MDGRLSRSIRLLRAPNGANNSKIHKYERHCKASTHKKQVTTGNTTNDNRKCWTLTQTSKCSLVVTKMIDLKKKNHRAFWGRRRGCIEGLVIPGPVIVRKYRNTEVQKCTVFFLRIAIPPHLPRLLHLVGHQPTALQLCLSQSPCLQSHSSASNCVSISISCISVRSHQAACNLADHQVG